MRGILLALAGAVVGGCSCQGTDIHGTPDSETDVTSDPGHEEEPVPECWDLDDDGHRDEGCGGDDCNDSDPSIHPGAPGICLDGVDQDCDTVADGPTVMSSALHLESVTTDGSFPSISWTGSEYAVFWIEHGEHWMARISPAGEHVEEPRLIFTYTYRSLHPSVVWTGSEFGLAYEDWLGASLSPPADVDVKFVRLSPTGDVLSVPVVLQDSACHATLPIIGWSGSEFGVAWRDPRDGACPSSSTCEDDLYFTRVDAEGAEIGTEEKIADATALAVSYQANLTWTGSEFALAWSDYLDGEYLSNHLSRISTAGSLVSEPAPLDSIVSEMAWSGSEFGIIWDDGSSGSWEVYHGRLDTSGVGVGTTAHLSDVPDSAGYPVLAMADDFFAAAWLDGRDRGCSPRPYEWLGDCHPDIYMAITDLDGTEIGDEVRITDSDGWKLWSSLAWSGSEFGIAWFEYSDEPAAQRLIYFDRIGFCE